MSVVKRRSEVVNGADPGAAGGPDELALAWPHLWEFLCTTTYDDGARRQTPSLTVFLESPLVKICLNDRDQGLTAWVSSTGLQGAFMALEKGLAGDCLEWRKPAQMGRKKR